MVIFRAIFEDGDAETAVDFEIRAPWQLTRRGLWEEALRQALENAKYEEGKFVELQLLSE